MLLIGSICSYSWAAENKLVEKSKKLAALEVQQLQAYRSWNYVIKNYIYFEEKYFAQEIKISSPEAYYNLPLAKRTALKAEKPKIAALEKLVPEATVLNSTKEIKRLKAKIKLLHEKSEDISFIKDQVKKFQNYELDIEPSGLDYLLGLDCDEIEATIPITKDQNPDLAVGHSKFFTQVHYATLREVFKLLTLKKEDVFYDLASGYGRASIYASILFPETTFKNIESVEQRVEAAKNVRNKLRLGRVNFYAADILKQDLSDGNIFFIFNPFPSLMPQILDELHTISKKKKIKIIALSGTVAELNVVPWLKPIYTVRRTHYTRTPGTIYESL